MYARLNGLSLASDATLNPPTHIQYFPLSLQLARSLVKEHPYFNIRPTERSVFAFGPEGSGLSSLAMALSMLGYRCCSDLQALPAPELERLLEGRGDRVFDAYVNIRSLAANVRELRSRYPKAKFILTTAKGRIADDT